MEVTNRKITKRQLSEIKISNTSYYNCVFEHIQLDNANLRDCEFEKCRFVNCSLKTIKLDFFKLIDCEFENCLLQGINASDIMFPCTFSLDSCEIRYIDFVGLRLQKSSFISGNFRDCLFEETDLRKSDFSGSAFYNTEFRHCDLSLCDFSMTDGLDINHEINKVFSITPPRMLVQKFLKGWGLLFHECATPFFLGTQHNRYSFYNALF